MGSKYELNAFQEAKLALLKSYELLTEKIKEGFCHGEVDNLWGRLARRDELIKKIEKLDSSLRELMSRGEAESPAIGYMTKGMSESYQRRTKQVLEQIALKEKDLIPVMSGETEKMKRELLRMRETRCAAANYTKPGAFSPRFLDARK